MNKAHELLLSIYLWSLKYYEGCRDKTSYQFNKLKCLKINKGSSTREEAYQKTLELNNINKALVDDLGYLYLNHERMQAKLHQYIECMTM